MNRRCWSGLSWPAANGPTSSSPMKVAILALMIFSIILGLGGQDAEQIVPVRFHRRPAVDVDVVEDGGRLARVHQIHSVDVACRVFPVVSTGRVGFRPGHPDWIARGVEQQL